MIRLKCEACGSPDLKRCGDRFVCEYCGSRYLLDKDERETAKELTAAEVVERIGKSKEFHREKRYVEELGVLEQAINSDEKNAAVWLQLGRCYRRLNMADRALGAYRQVILLNPYEGTAYTNMGAIYTLREEYEQAKDSYDKGLSLLDKCDFAYWVAYANYAVSIAKLGDPGNAEQMIREAEVRGYKKGNVIREIAGIKKKSFFSACFAWCKRQVTGRSVSE